MSFDHIAYNEIHQLREHFKLIFGDFNATAFVFNPGITGGSLQDVLRREGISYTELMRVSGLPEISEEAREQVEISAHYEGYIDKQKKQVERLQQQEGMLIPDGVDFANMEGLRLEARQKLSAIRPKNIGQASRISGVSPADIGVLLIQLKLLEEK